MNSLCHLVYEFVFSVFIIDVLFVYQAILLSVDGDAQNHVRHKRAYNGFEIMADNIPYIVFLSINMRSESSCIEVFCTGTLVHPRHVLTLKNCLDRDGFDNVEYSNMKVSIRSNFFLFYYWYKI